MLTTFRTLGFRTFARRSAASIAFFTLATAAVGAQARVPVVPEGMSVTATLTPGFRVGDIVYTSGQLGMARPVADTTIQGQTKLALENVKKVIEAAGSTMAQAIKCTVFLIDVKDFGGMNTAYREFFPASPPARSTVVVAALVQAGAKVEIECMAAMPAR
jgi:2-iminobutanoate/2-iminopropanoate deaminase